MYWKRVAERTKNSHAGIEKLHKTKKLKSKEKVPESTKKFSKNLKVCEFTFYHFSDFKDINVTAIQNDDAVENLSSKGKPKMKIISSTQSSSVVNNDSFGSLLAVQNERRRETDSVRDDRPNGELQMSWKLDNPKRKGGNGTLEEKSGQPKTARRSASKNVFRNMKSN